MNFKRTNLNYVLAFILILLLIIRSSIIRDIITPLFFYFYIIALNTYLFISEKIIISKTGIYLLFICTISLVLGLFFGWINPVLNSWNRLLIFFLMFNILGPLIINKNSTAFRSILFQLLLYALPIILLIDSFYVIYFRKITLGGHVEGFLEGPNLSGVIAALNILVFLIYILRSNKYLLKLFYFSFILLGVLILFASASRSAILALSICFFFLFTFNFKKIAILSFFLFLISILFLDYIDPFYQILISKIETRNNSGDISAGRSNMYLDNFSDFKKNPISGVGFYNMYNTTNSKINDDGSLEYPSGWLFILSSTGILGVLYFIHLYTTYFLFFINYNKIKFNILLFSFVTFFLIHSNFEGYIYSAGGLLFCLFWLSISNFNFYNKSENISNFS
jgi:hypothetical protein